MKKIIIALSLLFIPLLASASIDTNLHYGLQGSSQVQELQEFLITKGYFSHEATGNFFSLTLNAVKQYQTSEGINPTGYVGILTRTSINKELAINLDPSDQQSVLETGSVPNISPVQLPTQTQIQAVSPVVNSIQQVINEPLTPSTPVVVPSCSINASQGTDSFGNRVVNLTWTSQNTNNQIISGNWNPELFSNEVMSNQTSHYTSCSPDGITANSGNCGFLNNVSINGSQSILAPYTGINDFLITMGTISCEARVNVQ